MSGKLPYFKFYPGDWRKDAALARCSHEAKGVWIDMLCLMFDCQERGVLSSNGIAFSDENICFAVGGDFARTMQGLQELFSNGVVKKNASGAYFCSHMVHAEHIRQVRSTAGVKGGKKSGKSRRSKTRSKSEANSEAKLKQNCEYEHYIDSIPSSLDTTEFRTVLDEFTDYRKQLDKPLTALARKKLLNRLEKYGPAVGIEAMNQAIENGWQGVFPDKVSIPASAASRLPTDEEDAAWTPYGLQ